MPNSESTNNKIFLQKLEMQLLIICSKEDQRLYILKTIKNLAYNQKYVFLLSPALIKDMAWGVNS